MMKETIDHLIQKDLANGAFVGANAAVYQNGSCLYSGSFGMADREAGKPMAEDTIFRIYSMTKPVTAVAAMQLIERGILHPDDLVSWYFPSFSSAMVAEADGSVRPAKRDITIRDLLTMTSGMPYGNIATPTQKAVNAFYQEMEQRRDTDHAVNLEEYCNQIGSIPLEFDPGSHWEYGISADVLGGVIQKASGMEYRDYLKQHIFQPLGMKDTDFYVPAEKQDRFAAAYCFGEHGLQRDDGCYLGLNDCRTLPAFISGGAGLCSTIGDYARFAEVLANDGTSQDGIRLLSEHTMQYLRTPQVGGVQFRKDQQWDSLNGYEYGCLVRVLTNQAEAGTIASLGEFGWDGWTGTYFCADPSEKLTILFWIQVACAGTSRTAKCMRNIVYSNI